jgi:DNA-binding beta-propeller fold protein YncE
VPNGNGVSVIDIATNSVTLDRRIGNGPRRIAAAPDGRRIYVTNGEAVFVIDTPSNVIDTGAFIDGAGAVAVSPDSRLVYIAAGDAVAVTDATAHVIVPAIAVGLEPTSIALANIAGSCGAAPPACSGDCNGDAAVTVDELVTMVSMALATVSVSSCPAGDLNHDGAVTVDEILVVVGAAVNGCAASF